MTQGEQVVGFFLKVYSGVVSFVALIFRFATCRTTCGCFLFFHLLELLVTVRWQGEYDIGTRNCD